jgi:hypothetical protein
MKYLASGYVLRKAASTPPHIGAEVSLVVKAFPSAARTLASHSHAKLNSAFNRLTCVPAQPFPAVIAHEHGTAASIIQGATRSLLIKYHGILL